jgi:S1-C subfamily serine protease
LSDEQAQRAGAAVVVVRVQPDSPADLAGIQPNDLITALDGEDIHNAQELVSRLAAMQPGNTVQLQGLRGREAFKVKLKVVQRPTRQLQAR